MHNKVREKKDLCSKNRISNNKYCNIYLCWDDGFGSTILRRNDEIFTKWRNKRNNVWVSYFTNSRYNNIRWVMYYRKLLNWSMDLNIVQTQIESNQTNSKFNRVQIRIQSSFFKKVRIIQSFRVLTGLK